MIHHFTLDVSHYQFYVEDISTYAYESRLWEGTLPGYLLEDGTPVALIGTVLGTIPRAFAAATKRYGGDIDVEIETLDQPPLLDLDAWDHIVLYSLDVPSGRIRTYGCLSDPSEAPTIDLTPGTYNVLVYYGGFSTVDDNDGAGLTGDDHYRVTLWPGTFTEPRVLK